LALAPVLNHLPISLLCPTHSTHIHTHTYTHTRAYVNACAAVPPLPAQSNPAIASARAGPRIFVGKLTKETSEADVRDYFMRFGFVMDVYMPKVRACMCACVCALACV